MSEPELFDHLVGAGKQRRWDSEAEGRGGLRAPLPTSKPSALFRASIANTFSIPASSLASKKRSSSRNAWAAAWMSDDCMRPSGVLGLVRAARAVAFGISSRSNPRRFGARAAEMRVDRKGISVLPQKRTSSARSACRLRAKLRHRAIHSITSSARPSIGSGTVIPSALAVFRFMISSTFVAC